MASRKPYVRRRYWNEPRLGAWERSYLPELVRGLRITGGVFLGNMWKWLPFRKKAATLRLLHVPRSNRPPLPLPAVPEFPLDGCPMPLARSRPRPNFARRVRFFRSLRSP